MLAADVPSLNDLLADDLQWIHASGRVDSKISLLAAIGSGATSYQSISSVGETVRHYPNAAIITGLVSIVGRVNGQRREVHNRFSIVWVRRDGLWQAVNWQSTACQAVDSTIERWRNDGEGSGSDMCASQCVTDSSI